MSNINEAISFDKNIITQKLENNSCDIIISIIVSEKIIMPILFDV